MNIRTVTLTSLSVILAAAAPAAMADERTPATIFRVSANGPSMDDALKDATLVISHVCATGYVIVDNRIKLSSNGSFYYGAVSAHCTA